jgi:hypothetical protein
MNKLPVLAGDQREQAECAEKRGYVADLDTCATHFAEL